MALAPQTSPLPFIPICIGTIGSRVLIGPGAAVVQSTRAILGDLKRSYPHSPFVLLTSLAEGTDRLVAALAVEILDARILVILPFDADEYLKEFGAGESKEEFERLRAKAFGAIFVEQRETPGDLRGHTDARERQYARVSAFIAERCHILVALWDGKPSHALGDAAQVVQWKMNGEVPHLLASQGRENHILTMPKPGRVIRLHSVTGQSERLGANGAKDYDSLSAIDRYNSDLACALKKGAARAMEKIEGDLAGKNEALSQSMDRGVRDLSGAFAAADFLASALQKHDARSVVAIACAFFVALSFHNQHGAGSSTFIYLIFLLIVALLYKWSTRVRIEDRYLHYRALAEGLRVALFWRLAGLNRSVSKAYQIERAELLSWVKEALDSLTLCLTATGADQATQPANLAAVREAWLKDQTNYLLRKTEKLRKEIRVVNVVVQVSFAASWVAAAFQLSSKYYALGGPEMKPLVAWLNGTLLAAAVTITWYARKRALEQVLKRTTLTARLYERALAQLDAGTHPAQNIIAALGEEALSENASWLWAQREVSLKPKK